MLTSVEVEVTAAARAPSLPTAAAAPNVDVDDAEIVTVSPSRVVIVRSTLRDREYPEIAAAVDEALLASAVGVDGVVPAAAGTIAEDVVSMRIRVCRLVFLESADNVAA